MALREIARRHNIPITGEKATLIQRLLALPMADNWDRFTTGRLLTFTEVLGIHVPPGALRDAVIAILAADGSTVEEAKQALAQRDLLRLAQAQQVAAAAQQQAGPGNPNPNHGQQAPAPQFTAKLARQEPSESAEDFLVRAQALFRMTHMAREQAIAALLNAASAPMATFISEAYTLDNDLELQVLLQQLNDRFATPPYQAYRQFRAFKLVGAQTAKEAGNKLRQLYLRFLALPDAQVAAAEAVIAKTLLEQLLEVLPPQVPSAARGQLQQNPELDWDAGLQVIDAILTGYQSTPAGHRSTS